MSEAHERINLCFATVFYCPGACLVTECPCIVQILLSPLFVMSLIYVSVLVARGLLTFQVGIHTLKSYKRASNFSYHSSSDKQEKPF